LTGAGTVPIPPLIEAGFTGDESRYTELIESGDESTDMVGARGLLSKSTEATGVGPRFKALVTVETLFGVFSTTTELTESGVVNKLADTDAGALGAIEAFIAVMFATLGGTTLEPDPTPTPVGGADCLPTTTLMTGSGL
jgi:hypothetical protein